MKKRILCLMVLFGLGLPSLAQDEIAQVRVTATPVFAVIPTLTLPPTEIAIATPTVTLTPTPQGAALLEMSPTSTDVNIRSTPEIVDGNVVGKMERGIQYVVVGRYEQWWQFIYPNSPTGFGWAFDTLVAIIGNENDVPPVANPFVNAVVAAAPPVIDAASLSLTLAASTLTPGAEQTLSAGSRLLQAPTLNPEIATDVALANNQELPTFTPPAEVAPRTAGSQGSLDVTPTPDILLEAVSTLTSGNLPPMVPILLLAAGGLLGLLVSSLRR
jgi:hypothetical protein